MACCTGTKVNLDEFRTPGQKELGNILGPLFAGAIPHGATPSDPNVPLSMGQNREQMNAIQAMYDVGYPGKQYQPQPWQTMAPQGGLPGPMVDPYSPRYPQYPPRPPGLGSGDGGGGNDIIPPGRRSPFADPFDPRYLPGGGYPPYPYSTYDPTPGLPIKGEEKGGRPR